MRPPPYAAELARCHRAGRRPVNRQVEVEIAWRYGRRKPAFGVAVVVVADGESPRAFDWRWTRDLDVVVFDRDHDYDRVAKVIAAIRPMKPRRFLVVRDGRGTADVLAAEVAEHA